MSYFETYKNRLNQYGGSPTNERLKNTENFIISEFKNDPSYRLAKMHKPNNITLPIDVRVVNIDKSVYEKKIYTMPNDIVDVGDYIEFDNKVYLVNEFEDNVTSPYCKVKLCNQVIYLPNNKTINSVVEGESYGVKLIGGNDFFDTVDTKVKITIADTKENRNIIKQDTRVCFAFSEFGIYKIGDISVYEKGLLVCIAKKDKYLIGLDNLETGIMFQGEEDEIVNYEIQGSESMRINQDHVYKIDPQVNCIFEVDDNSVQIIQSGTQCVLRATASDMVFTLIAKVNNEILVSKNIYTTRW